MKHYTHIKLFLIAFSLFSGSVNLLADTYSNTIGAKVWSAYGEQTLSSVVWNAVASGGEYWDYNATKGQQFGAAASPATTLSLSTSGISGTITDIKITTSGANSIAGTVSISVGGTNFTCNSASTASLTSTSSTYDFTGSATGAVLINWVQTSSKALYVKSIEITYTNCIPSNLAFSNNSVTKFIGNAAFTQTPTSLNTTAIIYSSSSNGVATVNSLTGEVTIIGVGTTTITASQATAGGYCADNQSYTITVNPLPTLTVTDVTDLILTSVDGSNVTQTINVSGVNLTNNLDLSITGSNANLFALSQCTVEQATGIAPNTVITITYSPIAVENLTATLKMSSIGATDVTRTLNGICDKISDIKIIQPQLNVRTENGEIIFTANSGESLDIFNAIGQKLICKYTVEGLNIISVSEQGVMIVKVGNRVAKIILQ